MAASKEEREYWDSLYQRQEYVYGTAPNRYLLAYSALLQPGMKALAAGDGEGRNGIWLASQGLAVVSVDLSPFGIEKARRLGEKNGSALDFECCDLTDWGWPVEAYDLVVATYLHLKPRDREHVHHRMVEALRLGGLVILEAFDRRQLINLPPNSHDADSLYTTAILRRDFRDLEILEVQNVVANLDEGCMHQGEAEVVHLLGRKRHKM